MKNGKKIVVALLALLCVGATGCGAVGSEGCAGMFSPVSESSGVDSNEESSSKQEESKEESSEEESGSSTEANGSSEEENSSESDTSGDSSESDTSGDSSESDTSGDASDEDDPPVDLYENYVKIIDKTVVADGEWTTVVPPALSEASMKIQTSWSAVDFTSQSLVPYTSLVFWMKAEQDGNTWISINDRVGYYNEKGQQLYGVKDDNWHKFELKRETIAGENSYRLYVDDVMVERLDDGLEVDARAKNKLSDFNMFLEGTYYITETFGVVDPNYEENALAYEIVMQSPITADVDDYEIEDVPCRESVQVNVYGAGQWRQNTFAALELAPYSYVKFYLKAPEGWAELICGGEQIFAKEASNDWHEIVLEKINGEFAIMANGSYLDAIVSKNLNELKTAFSADATYYISEVFAVTDENYVPPEYVPLLEHSPYGEAEQTSAELQAPVDFIDTIYEFVGEDYASHALNSFNLLPYERAMFYVCVADASSGANWLQITDGGNDSYLAVNDGDWHQVSFMKEGGYTVVSVDGYKKVTITDLSQLSFAITPGASYYLTEICGYADDKYEGVTLTAASGEGYTVNVDYVQLNSDAQATVQKGAKVTFAVEVSGQYDKTNMAVKVNGETLTMENGVYTYVAEADLTITVEGVVKRETPKDLGDYVVAQDCIFVEDGATVDMDKIEDTMSKQSTIVSRTWSLNPNIEFAVAKEAKYTELKFYILGEKAGQYLQIRLDGGASDILAFQGDNATFYEIKFVKVNDTWNVYFSGNETAVAEGVASINSLDVYMNGTYYVSELFGLVDPNYVAPAPVIVLENPVAKDASSTTTEDLAAGASITNVIAGGWAAGGTALKDFDLAPYTEVKFFFKANGSAWFEVLDSNGNSLGSDNQAVWNEVRLTKEGDSWRLYVKGAWVNYTCTNLSDLRVQLGNDADFFISNVIGTADPNYVAPEEPEEVIVLENPVAKDASSTTTEDLAAGASITNVITGGWAAVGTALKDFDLAPYTEVKFFFKADGSAWFEVLDASGSQQLGADYQAVWNEVRLTKEGDSWRLYVNGEWKNYTCTNLSDLHVQLGDNGTFLVSNLMGIADPDYVPPVYEVVTENVFSVEATDSEEAAPEGFEKVVSHTTTWNKYNFNSCDLTPYTEVKFAVKSSGWYGVMSDASTVINETNGGGDWLIISLVKNGGNWDLYYGGTNQQTLTLTNNNLTDLNFRFGDNTYYVTELRGIADPNYVAPAPVIVLENPVAKDASSTTTEDLAAGASITNVIAGGWAAGGTALKDFDLAPYTEVKFFFKANGSAWFEVLDSNGNSLGSDNQAVWNEVRLTKEGDSWRLYVKGAWVNYTCTNLSDLHVQLGNDGTFYVSNLIVTE